MSTHTGCNLVITRCAVCHADLSDSLSIERGVGPTCWRHVRRSMDQNVVEPSWPLAVVTAEQLDPATWPDAARERLKLVRSTVQITGGLVAEGLGGTFNEDNTVKALVNELRWLACWTVTPTQSDLVVELVRVLGFPSLAGLLTGHASTGKSRVFARDGRIWLVGSRCTAGNRALKAIPGRQAHPSHHDGFAWSVPVTQAAAFRDVVMRYWPNTNFDLAHADAWRQVVAQLSDADRDLAMAALANGADTATSLVLEDLVNSRGGRTDRVPQLPPATVMLTTDLATWPKGSLFAPSKTLAIVDTPYDRGLIDRLKTLGDWKSRAWNAQMKVWVLDAKLAEQAADAVREFFPQVIVDLEVAA